MAEGLTCEVVEDYRTACEGGTFYDSQEGKRYCVVHLTGERKREAFEQVKERKLARKDYNFRGAIFPEGTSNFQRHEFFDAEVDFAGATFVGVANFSEASFSGGRTDFVGASFSGEITSFLDASFSGEVASFARAEFSGEVTSFSGAQFSGYADFFGARFSGEEGTSFAGASFSEEGTTFVGARFRGERTDFSRASFRGERTDFSVAHFSSPQDFFSTDFEGKVDFSRAAFDKSVRLRGKVAEAAGPQPRPGTEVPEPHVVLDGISIGQPDASLFQSVSLRPSWLVNVVDVRKLRLIDVRWSGVVLETELQMLAETGSPHELLARTCQELAANAEENRDYPLANKFYYWAMEALRKAGWSRLGLIATLYWILSGYGVRPRRAFGMLVAMWAFFALLYMVAGPSELKVFSIILQDILTVSAQDIWTFLSGLRVPSVSEFGQAIANMGPACAYSLGALARLRPEPQPDEPGWFQALVTVEGILGPLQIALLALAIRRQVMR